MVTTLEKNSTMSLIAPVKRPTLNDLDYLSAGKRGRLYRMLHQFGPGNGTMMFLPIDQGLEHGPIDFFENPASADPDFQCQLALEGNYSAVVFHYGLAEKYIRNYAGRVPLVLKINGKTCIPSDSQAFSPLTARVEDAVRLGADAIGYTLYVGSPSQDRDIQQFVEVRNEAERLGMPIIMWAYPRGEAVEKKGGKDSLYAIDYASRVACELGADVVKINIPKIEHSKKADQPAEYKDFKCTVEEGIRKVVRSAGKTMVVFSGGSKLSDADVVAQAKSAMDGGATGLIFGRNMWQRPMNEALTLSADITRMLQTF